MPGQSDRYREMRRQGLCPIAGCGKDTGGFAFCKDHRRDQADANARRRAAGLSVNLSLRPEHAADLDYVCGELDLSRQDALRMMIKAFASEVKTWPTGTAASLKPVTPTLEV